MWQEVEVLSGHLPGDRDWEKKRKKNQQQQPTQ